jgi:cytochrome c oxidase subunit 3
MSENAAALREPWPDVRRQHQGVSFGVWVFLASELLFFGSLLMAYTVYRHMYPEAFRTAARETEVFYGTLNTAILMTSSLTMAVAVRAAEQARRRLTVWCLAATVGFGLAFLVVKGFEYRDDIAKGLLPGPHFALHPPATELFWTFYWILTGLHAIHLTIGIGIVTTLAVLAVRRAVPIASASFEATALYWHLVDIIWVVLLPLLYLIGRA